jgi:hypothetical protein
VEIVEAAMQAFRKAGFVTTEAASEKQRAAVHQILKLNFGKMKSLTRDLLGSQVMEWDLAAFLDLQRAMSVIMTAVNSPGKETILATTDLVMSTLQGGEGIPSNKIDWNLVCETVLPTELGHRAAIVKRAARGSKPWVNAKELCQQAQREMEVVVFCGGPMGAIMLAQGVKRKAEMVEQTSAPGRGAGGYGGYTGSYFACGEAGHKAGYTVCSETSKQSKGAKGGKGGAGKGTGKGKGKGSAEFCKDFQKGVCPRGEECEQEHFAAVCHAFKEGKPCRFGDGCKFRHVL